MGAMMGKPCHDGHMPLYCMVSSLLIWCAMDTKQLIDFWQRSGLEDIKTAEALFAAKRYTACLFFCHLFIEKMLKACYVAEIGDTPPLWHNLVRLAQKASLELTEKQWDLLAEVNYFNIAGRYEDYQRDFYRISTRAYTKKYLVKSLELHAWLLEKLFRRV